MIHHFSDGLVARKINGVWFQIIMEPIRDNVRVNDIFGTTGSREYFIKKYGSAVYAATKKALNKEQLERYGISND